MKTVLSLLACAASVSMAETPRFVPEFLGGLRPGVVAHGGYDLAMVGQDVKDGQGVGGVGFGGGISLTAPVTDQFLLDGQALFLMDNAGYKTTSKDGNTTTTLTYKSNRLGLRLTPTYMFNNRIGALVGYQYELPMGGKLECKSSGAGRDTSYTLNLKSAPSLALDNADANGIQTQAPVVAVHNLVVGARIQILSWLSSSVEAKYAINSTTAEYNSRLEYRGPARDFKTTQLSLGVKAELP